MFCRVGIMLLCSGLIITVYNPLYSADHKEQKKDKPTPQWHYEPCWDLLGPWNNNQYRDSWTDYIEAIQEGNIDSVSTLLPLMATAATTPKNYFNYSEELPFKDCSGLAAVIEAKGLSYENKIKLIAIIRDFFQPKKKECEPRWFFPCKSLCNQLRETFVIYGLAKAGERCLALEGSDALREHIYGTCQAYITQDAIAILKEQKKTDLEDTFTKRRAQQHEHKQLLLIFNCIKSSNKEWPNGNQSEYYRKVAQPVITGIKPGCSQKLCRKE